MEFKEWELSYASFDVATYLTEEEFCDHPQKPKPTIVEKNLVNNVHEYSTKLLNMPREEAIKELDETSPKSVEAFYDLYQLQQAKGNDEAIVSLNRMLYAIEEYEMCFLQESKNSPPSNGDFEGWSAPLIDVYANYDTFKLQRYAREEDKIGKFCFSDTPPVIKPNETAHSVVDESTFQKNFQIFTEGQFDGWKEWENMVVIGGSMVASLLPVPTADVAKYYHEVAYKNSDIDVYFYGLSDEEFARKVTRLYEHLVKVNGKVVVLRTKFTITFCSQYPKRHIQVVIGKWNNIPEIVFEPDIDCTCVVYDGARVWATQRSRFSLNHRCLVTSERRYSARGHPEYESRLIKYSKRGFFIWDKILAPDFSNISFRLLMSGRDRIIEHKTISGRVCVTGLRLLLIGYFWPKMMESVRFFMDPVESAKAFKDEGLPYGPEWTLTKLLERLKAPVFEDSHYGPYEVTSPYQIVNDITDWQSIMSPHRDKLTDITVNQGCYFFYDYIMLAQDTRDTQKLVTDCKTNSLSNFAFLCLQCSSHADFYNIVYPNMSRKCNRKCLIYASFGIIPTGIVPLNDFVKVPACVSAKSLFELKNSQPISSPAPLDSSYWNNYCDRTNYTPPGEIAADKANIETMNCGVDTHANPLVKILLDTTLDEKQQLAKIDEILGKEKQPTETLSPSLLIAIEKGLLNVVKALIAAGANVNTVEGPLVPLVAAVKTGENIEMVKLLTEAGASLGANRVVRICLKSKQGGLSVEMLTLLLNHLEMQGWWDEDLENLFALIFKGNRVDLMKVLLDNNAANLYGYFGVGEPLHPMEYATRHNWMDMVKLMLNYPNNGANETGDRCMNYKTPLINSIRQGNMELLKLLVEKGDADVNAAYNIRLIPNVHPLQEAALAGNLAMVKYLVEKGARRDNEAGQLAIRAATEKGYSQIVQYLRNPL